MLNVKALILAAFMANPQYDYSITHQELKCMADNVYYEARNSVEGMVLVAQVTYNRMVARGGWRACEVVYERRNGQAQFSWTTRRQNQPIEEARYEMAVTIAYHTLISSFEDLSDGAQWFTSKKDHWFKSATARGKIIPTRHVDGHTFYR